MRRAYSIKHNHEFVPLMVGQSMRCIQCLKLLRRERQRERDGVLLYVRRQAGFGNCDNVTDADGPGQRDGGRRAAVCCADTCKRGVTQQAGTTERSIGHHRHAALLAPWQQIILNAAATDVVKDLIGRTAIAVWNTIH